MQPKKAILIILALTLALAIVFAFFYFNKLKPVKETQNEPIPVIQSEQGGQDTKAEEERKALEELRDKYKVDNNSPEQLKRQHEALEELRKQQTE